ncbi:hypothetical protein SynBIOSE41_02502 [Synechococcus sp. BIOS-E4-1]|nr:hypothetical protein SynBIOSE41_02502 [Synechococcus sp. BIOS-E4-1]
MCNVRLCRGCWLAISHTSAVFSVDGSQQWNGQLRFAPFCLQITEVFQKHVLPFIGHPGMATPLLGWQSQNARVD